MSGIYLHIPFCDTKCIYCDFYSITDHRRKIQFIETLINEIESKSEELKDYEFDTLFFGGGTPSLLSAEDFSGIFAALRNNFNIRNNSEVTIEANPGTLDKHKLFQLCELPINRISFGVQSFIPSELKFLTRIHTAEQAIQCVKQAQAGGFDNINVDLIFALPGQTLNDWKYNLETALSLDTQHISAYSLIFEEGTHLKTMLDTNKTTKADEELEAEMYEHTIEFLTQNGFQQYEISNFAKPGFECRHNLKYWSHEEYIGFGPSAASFIKNQRWVNVRNLNEYIDRIDKIDIIESIDKRTSKEEFIFLGLRSKGVDIREFRNKYGEDLLETHGDALKILTEKKLAALSANSLRLTPMGYAVCDEIVSTYF